MPNRRGRPPRPPRSDHEEIKRNAAERLRNAKAEVADRLSAKLSAIDDGVDAPEIDLPQLLRDIGTVPPAWVLDAACNALAMPFAVREVKQARVAAANAPPGALATPFALRLVGHNEDRTEVLRILSTQIRAPGPGGTKARLILFLNAKAKFEAFVATFPTASEYRDLLLGFYVPIFNAAHASERRCLDCGQEFALRTSAEVAASRHCSEPCARRASKRGRERVGNGRSAVENAARKFGDKIQRHLKGCTRCIARRVCPTFESLLAMSNTDALDRLRGELRREPP